jgi:hypothetical protein
VVSIFRRDERHVETFGTRSDKSGGTKPVHTAKRLEITASMITLGNVLNNVAVVNEGIEAGKAGSLTRQ